MDLIVKQWAHATVITCEGQFMINCTEHQTQPVKVTSLRYSKNYQKALKSYDKTDLESNIFITNKNKIYSKKRASEVLDKKKLCILDGAMFLDSPDEKVRDEGEKIQNCANVLYLGTTINSNTGEVANSILSKNRCRSRFCFTCAKALSVRIASDTKKTIEKLIETNLQFNVYAITINSGSRSSADQTKEIFRKMGKSLSAIWRRKAVSYYRFNDQWEKNLLGVVRFSETAQQYNSLDVNNHFHMLILTKKEFNADGFYSSWCDLQGVESADFDCKLLGNNNTYDLAETIGRWTSYASKPISDERNKIVSPLVLEELFHQYKGLRRYTTSGLLKVEKGPRDRLILDGHAVELEYDEPLQNYYGYGYITDDLKGSYLCDSNSNIPGLPEVNYTDRELKQIQDLSIKSSKKWKSQMEHIAERRRRKIKRALELMAYLINDSSQNFADASHLWLEQNHLNKKTSYEISNTYFSVIKKGRLESHLERSGRGLMKWIKEPTSNYLDDRCNFSSFK